MIRVKRRVVCKCLQIDDAASLEHFIGMFGVTAVVVAKKCPPPVQYLRSLFDGMTRNMLQVMKVLVCWT